MVLFSQILTYTWGQGNIAYSKIDISVIMTLGSMIMFSDTEKGLKITSFETQELIYFFTFCILMQYTLKMCIICHSASVILEQFTQVDTLRLESQEPKYHKYQIKSVVKEWLKHACSFQDYDAASNAKAKKKKG